MGILDRLLGRRSPESATMSDAWLMQPERDVTLQVVGESNYQGTLERLAGGRSADGVAQPYHMAALVPEPRNRYDRNAISIRVGGQVVGYLSREDAVAYGPVVRWAQAQGRYIAANARLTGGWDRNGGDRGSIGVVLHMGTPAETLVELWAAQQPVRPDHRWAGCLVVFTGTSSCVMNGVAFDRYASEYLARRHGMLVHPRVTKKVQLLVDCDDETSSGKQRQAQQYGIPIVSEREFWGELGVGVEFVDRRGAWSPPAAPWRNDTRR